MFQEQKRKLVIVCDEKTKIYATQLTQLISDNDDVDDKIVGCKDGTVVATIWDEKQYRDNEPTLSTEQDILFIGKSKASKAAISALEDKEIFNEHGIHFYKRGNMSAIVVEDRMLKKDEYTAFIEFSKKNDKEFKTKASLNPLNSANNVLKGIGILLPYVYPIAIYSIVAGNKAKKQIIDQQYKLGVFYFYMTELNKFLEE